MTKILCIGLGGVGVIGAYALEKFNSDVQVTAVIRSDYDKVTTEGYTIHSCDYGGLIPNKGIDPENAIKEYKPKHVVKSVENAAEFGPFDYIVISTKVTPGPKGTNIWDQVAELPQLLYDGNAEEKTSLVLIQNGIDIERYWSAVASKVTMISGVTYISSINNNAVVTQFTKDMPLLGLFEKVQTKQDLAALDKFIGLYSNPHNAAKRDDNVRLTRWKKLLYNSSFNTVCCLTDLDVGHVFFSNVVSDVITPLMQEVKLVANEDLKQNYQSSEFVTQDDIDTMLDLTEKHNTKNHYTPSMLVDLRNNRQIELEILLGNVVSVYKETTKNDPKLQIPYLNLLNYLLTMVQYRIKLNKK
ncbi:uncharacterized protein CLIB1423_02S04368 [[Candida] railenensis]|uniref:2-dehydropantoate 2-reductase n=1 Tax=[Candida] railenensis TaxID=45579 RepID=A0A9P0QLA6_9ASCO|nr:uncharacterized protein CLIB1423_02S04368 [[Candida] railenensis]